MDRTDPLVTVEVVYALAGEQMVRTVKLARGSTIRDALAASGIARRFPDIDLETCRVGVFGRRCAAGTVVGDGDRVEIYRSLDADPKEARRARVARDEK